MLLLAELVDQAVSEGYPVVEQFYDLAVGGEVEPVEVYDPDVEDVEFQVDPHVESVLTGSSLSFEEKKKIVEYWNSNVHKKRPLSSMQSRFRSAGITHVGIFITGISICLLSFWFHFFFPVFL